MMKQHQVMPRFLFRCDASPMTGIGHLRRCSALAAELNEHGASAFFACRSAGLDLAKELHYIASGWTVLDWSLTPESDAQEVIQFYKQHKIDVAIIDHYRADADYQQRLYSSGVQWLQFDGFAQQPLWADWVLNASPAAEESIYLSLKQREQTRLLLGPAYALLRREFRWWRPRRRFRERVRKILLTFGGGDDKGATVFCLEATKSLEPAIERVVLVSSTNRHAADIMDWLNKNSSLKVTLLVDEPEIARQMAGADLAITAGGTTTFETAAMGLPSLIIQLADNQKLNATAWERRGVAVDLGPFGSLTPSALEHQVVKLLSDPKLRKSMAHTDRVLVDCLGAERVAQILLSGE